MREPVSVCARNKATGVTEGNSQGTMSDVCILPVAREM